MEFWWPSKGNEYFLGIELRQAYWFVSCISSRPKSNARSSAVESEDLSVANVNSLLRLIVQDKLEARQRFEQVDKEKADFNNMNQRYKIMEQFLDLATDWKTLHPHLINLYIESKLGPYRTSFKRYNDFDQVANESCQNIARKRKCVSWVVIARGLRLFSVYRV